MRQLPAAALRPLAIALVLTIGIAATPIANWTAADDGKTVAMKVGDQATVTLQASAGTGYSWKLAATDAKVVAVGEVKIDADATPGLVGGPVKYSWTVTALAAGAADLQARLVRPWMPDQPAQAVTIHVQVK